jgi:hypothetical protein
VIRLLHWRHRFYAEQWKLVSATRVGAHYLFDSEISDIGVQRVYSNTCIVCGDLVFRRVKEIE